MRSREERETSTKMYDQLTIEVLLDIRELLFKQPRKIKRKYTRKNKKQESV